MMTVLHILCLCVGADQEHNLSYSYNKFNSKLWCEQQ